MKSIGIPLQYGCFVCRKSFKRPQFSGANNCFMTSEQAIGQRMEAKHFEVARQYKCPDCGGQSHYMGADFKAPKQSDVREWQQVEQFIRSGKLYIR